MIRIKNPNYIERIPSEYQEVEYLESTKEQYINTNYLGDSNSEYIVKGYIIYAANSTSNYILGTNQYGSSNLGGIGVNSNMRQYFGTWRRSSSASETIYPDLIPDMTPHVFKLNKDSFYVDDIATNFTYNYEFSDNNSTILFGGKSGSSLSSCRIYYAKIYDNGTLVKHFIPVYRKSDKVAGMYDLINGVFYTNNGSGDFLIGKEINTPSINLEPLINSKPILKRYLGERLIYECAEKNFNTCPFPATWNSFDTMESYIILESSNEYGRWVINSNPTYGSSYGANLAFDNSTSTRWRSSGLDTDQHAYLEIECPCLIKPSSLSIVYQYVGTGSVIEGYDDTTEKWDILYELTATSTVKTESPSLQTNKFYKKFRVNCLRYGSSSSNKYVYISEFRIISGTLKKDRGVINNV